MSATPGNQTQNYRSHIAMSHQLSFALESVANAHTAADLHVRSWVSYRAGQESHGRRERSNKYTMGDFPQSVIRRAFRSLGLCCNAAIAALHTEVFESAHRILGRQLA